MNMIQAPPIHTTVVGVFEDQGHALAAATDLRRAGFSNDQIAFLGPDLRPAIEPRPERPGLENDPTHTRWEEGAGLGAAAGASVGSGLGLAIAAGLLSPIGPAVAGGVLVTWLATMGAGAAAGTVVGALVGLGVPEEEGRWYEDELKHGRTLVIIQDADERAEDARQVLRQNGAAIREPSDVGTYGTGLPSTPY
jgi:hypothetical protein